MTEEREPYELIDEHLQREPTPEECPFRTDVSMIAARLFEIGMRQLDLDTEHDDWCPAIGGDGSRPCQPGYFMTIAELGVRARINLDSLREPLVEDGI